MGLNAAFVPRLANVKSADDCPDRAKHTSDPPGYLQWHAWAEKKAKTHVQIQCPTCGFWAIWKRKPKPTPTASAGLLSAHTGTFKAGG